MASERILVTTQTLASCLAPVKPVVAKRSVTDTPEGLLVASWRRQSVNLCIWTMMIGVTV